MDLIKTLQTQGIAVFENIFKEGDENEQAL